MLLILILRYRARTHANKFVLKFLRLLPDFLGLIPKVRGWSIATFKYSENVCELNISAVPEPRAWFRINNRECAGIADPFLFKNNDLYYLFFEYEYKKHFHKVVDIAYATSKNGTDWKFEKKILKESFPKSFPHVFEMEGDVYMLPECYKSSQVEL